jgi:hypothetical protein
MRSSAAPGNCRSRDTKINAVLPQEDVTRPVSAPMSRSTPFPMQSGGSDLVSGRSEAATQAAHGAQSEGIRPRTAPSGWLQKWNC